MTTNKRKSFQRESKWSEDVTSSSHRNPMLNTVILERLLKFCGRGDLRLFRLVCREWYSLSLTQCRKELVVRIHAPCTQDKFYWAREKGWLRWESLSDELDVGEKPFRSFHLTHYKFGHFGGPNLRSMSQFWANYGDNIRKLALSTCYVVSVRAFKKVIFELLPNLEELQLDDLNKYEDEEGESDMGEESEVLAANLNLKTLIIADTGYDSFPAPWPIFLAQFPNIHTLVLRDFQWYLSELVSALEEVMMSHPRGKTTIRQLQLTRGKYGNHTTLKQLFQLPILTLETLGYDTKGLENWERGVVPVALQSHGSTLRKLNLRADVDELRPFYDTYDSFPYYTETFECLTELKLYGKVCPDLHFLRQMPQLKKLQVSQHDDNMFQATESTRLEGVRLPHLTHLSLGNFLIPEETMKMLVTLMPNLECFEGPLLTPSFRVICKSWSTLKSLRVISGLEGVTRPYSVEGVTGIGDEGITGIVAGREGRLPNVTDLKCLQYFSMGTTGKMSAVSVWDGFLHVPRLTTLRIGATMEPRLSDEANQALKRHCPGAGITSLEECITQLWMKNSAQDERLWDT